LRLKWYGAQSVPEAFKREIACWITNPSQRAPTQGCDNNASMVEMPDSACSNPLSRQ
jgi:hypothetical protein